MNDKIYKQYDKPWKGLPYPTYSSLFGDNGCGPCAVLHVAIEQESKKDWTPENVRAWMVDHGYAVPGHGTEWAGIEAALLWIGHKNVVWIKTKDPMSMAWDELDKGNRIGVLLVDDGYTPDGTVWTSSGHYVGFSAYEKHEDGTHWFFIKDSGPRDHDGWFCYEKSIRGAVPQLFIVERLGKDPTPTPTPTPTPDGEHYAGPYPNPKRYLEFGDKGTEVGKLQDYLNWYTDGDFYKKCGGRDNIYGRNTLAYCKQMQADFFGPDEANGEVGPKTIAKMKAYAKPKKPTPTPTPVPTDYTKVIDVSAFQDEINWTKVKAAGVDGAIIKCGYRHAEGGALDEDSMFLDHIKGAVKAGLKVGVYFFTEAVNAAEGKEEAEYTLRLIEKAGVALYYPIGIDSEDVFWENPDGSEGKGRANAGVLSMAKRTEAIKAFCETIKAHGGQPMIYASLAWFFNQLDRSQLPYYIWCAQWGSECDYPGAVALWQYTSKGSIDGVSGRVDVNRCYLKSPAPAPTPTPGKKPYSGHYPTADDIRKAQIGGLCQACRDQTSWSYSSIYEFENNPTIPKSRYKSTCVTYLSCVMQRAGLLNSGDCLWHDGTGFGDGHVRGTTSQMEVTYYNNKKSLNQLSLQTGDMLFYDDNKSGQMGNGGHEEMFNGSISGNTYYFYSGGTGSGHNTSNNNSESGNRKVLAVVRIKPRTYIKKGDIGSAVTDLQNYLDWYFDGAFFKACGPADGVFGKNTHNWTVKMQTDLFGAAEADGDVGPKTIAKMQEVAK